MSSFRTLVMICAALAVSLFAGSARADLGALARVSDDSRIVEAEGGAELVLELSQPVPWRVFLLDAPRRAVVDLSEVVWPDTMLVGALAVDDLRMGAFQPGWSRLVIDLSSPHVVAEAEMATGAADGTAALRIRFAPTDPATFAERAGTPDDARFRLAPRKATPAPDGDARLHVMLDPGHGGIDPGAEAGGLVEADLMLTFARELREALLRAGDFRVSMTRDADVFVPLETRISLAREAGVDVFLSLHADALPEDAGRASGATIYTLSDDASDLASQRLAERHDQSDLLAGVDLTGQGDEIALVLMEIARRETEPRTERLATSLISGLRDADVAMNSRPRRSAGFSVLKAPDIPSVLIEIGFLSSADDRANLAEAAWRKAAANGIRDALRAWAMEEARRAALLRP
ncbi:MAG: N-acetylmuramoyl-L-alanine amidase [Pseudomonadota bacterium]